MYATFFVGILHLAGRLYSGLIEGQKRHLFDEHIAWYQIYIYIYIWNEYAPGADVLEEFRVY